MELGPKPTLLALVAESWPAGPSPTLLASLRLRRPEPEAMLEALGGHYARGGAVDWKGVFPAASRRVDLPTYPWQRQRYWVKRRPPKLGAVKRPGIRSSECASRWRAPERSTSRRCRSQSSLVGDHRVGGPSSCPRRRSWRRSARRERIPRGAAEVLSLVLRFVRDPGSRRAASAGAHRQQDGRTHAKSTARRRTLERNGRGRFTPAPKCDRRHPRFRTVRPGKLAERYASRRVSRMYRRWRHSLGPTFRVLQSVLSGPKEALVEMALPPTVEGAEAYGVPALLTERFS